MKLTAIVAIDRNNGIGYKNQLPWYLPADLKYFKKQTLQKPVIMGRQVYDSIGHPLPKRTNIILTRNPFFIVSNALVAHDRMEALELASSTKASEAMIIGGTEIYKLYWNLLDKLIVTQVEAEFEVDRYFPEIRDSDWKVVSSEHHDPDERNEWGYNFVTYERRTNPLHMED